MRGQISDDARAANRLLVVQQRRTKTDSIALDISVAGVNIGRVRIGFHDDKGRTYPAATVVAQNIKRVRGPEAGDGGRGQHVVVELNT